MEECAKLVDDSGLTLDERGFRFASQEFGLLFLRVSFQTYQETEQMINHWSEHSRPECEAMINSIKAHGRITITFNDLYPVMAKAPAPGTTDPTTSQNPATAGA